MAILTQPDTDTSTQPARPRRRLLRQALVLLALLAVVDLAVVLGIEPLALAGTQGQTGTAVGRMALYHHAAAPLDVLLMGSSRVQCDLSPSLMMNRAGAVYSQTVSILNLGLAGGTPQSNYWLLKNVVSTEKQPKLIIYGTSEYEFNPNGGRIPPSNYSDELATLADYSQAFPEPSLHIDWQLSFLVGRPWHLFRYRTTLHDMLLDATSDTGDPTGAPDPYGFLPLNHEMRPIDVRKLQTVYQGPGGHLQNYTVVGYLATRFEEFLRLAQSRGIAVVVINMPITKVHESWLSPADYAAYRAYLRATAARYGVPFFDYDDHSLWQEPGDFADTNHMNRVGAKKLSNMVSKDVLLPTLARLGWK